MKKKMMTVVGAVAAFALIFGGVSAVSAIAQSGDAYEAAATRLPDASTAVAPSYDVNAAGQTYGSALAAQTVEQQPELSLVITDQRGEAYVYTRELNGAEPTGLAVTDTREITLTAYQADGITIAGTYTYGGVGQ